MESKELANPKLPPCQSLIFYLQQFGKSMGGGPNDPLPLG